MCKKTPLLKEQVVNVFIESKYIQLNNTVKSIKYKLKYQLMTAICLI